MSTNHREPICFGTAAKQKATLHTSLRYLPFALLYIMHISRSSASGSSTPMTAFAPPSYSLAQKRSLASQGTAQIIDYRTTVRYSSMRERQSVTSTYQRSNRMERKRNTKSIMRKTKSPSNSYTQFYKEGVLVGIEATSPNSRRISGEIIMDIPIHDIWSILTDYDNLSTHVPNLMESKVINNGRRIVGGRPRVYQRGAQRIFGFEFGADVTMDMAENVHHSQNDNDGEAKIYSIDFECVDSQFFSQFDGSWILEEYSNAKTMVRYIVDVKPKGPVPVAALEWRIKEDVPVNIVAVSKSARAVGVERQSQEQAIMAMQETVVEEEPREEAQPQLVRQSPLNPLQQLTDQAAYNLKRTAKSVLPTPVISTARRAIRAINGPKAVSPSRVSRQSAVVPSMSLNGRGGSKNKVIRSTSKYNSSTSSDVTGREHLISSKSSTFVDWYEDETLSMYLKDS